MELPPLNFTDQSRLGGEVNAQGASWALNGANWTVNVPGAGVATPWASVGSVAGGLPTWLLVVAGLGVVWLFRRK